MPDTGEGGLGVGSLPIPIQEAIVDYVEKLKDVLISSSTVSNISVAVEAAQGWPAS